jgi:hypothetical protein
MFRIDGYVSHSSHVQARLSHLAAKGQGHFGQHQIATRAAQIIRKDGYRRNDSNLVPYFDKISIPM